MHMDIEQLKFPIGQYIPNKQPDQTQLDQWIATIAAFPAEVEKLVQSCSAEQLNWQYRPEGWTVKQVIHHCADSHLNSIMRFKLTLTEETPTIKPYFEDRWANLSDANTDDVTASLMLLKGLHAKWATLLRSLSSEQLQLEFMHPEHGQTFNLAETIGNYAWHCEHHLAHVKNGLESNGQYN